MVYYVVDSCHNDRSGGGAEGWMYLKEVQGESMPKSSLNHNANGFIRMEYFSTYKEAKDFFQTNFMAYLNGRNFYIDTHDMVGNDKCIVDN
ncbi:MAG: hypothetical protein FWD26_00010 [Treponema sp.]|nr:hypothetical protein [Treponema sp.]